MSLRRDRRTKEVAGETLYSYDCQVCGDLLLFGNFTGQIEVRCTNNTCKHMNSIDKPQRTVYNSSQKGVTLDTAMCQTKTQ
jgi:phage FluMu protein Com